MRLQLFPARLRQSFSPSAMGQWVIARPALAVFVITSLALALRLYKLTYRDYFDDEFVSIFAARLSPIEMFDSLVAITVHPPLYYVLLHFWALFLGESTLSIRLLSVFISTACVPLIYMLGRELVSKPVGLIAALFMACAPFHVWHGQQARMYPLLTLLVLLTTFFFVRAWRNGGGWWLWFGISTAAGFYTHIYFPFSLLALNLWAIYTSWADRRFPRDRWVGLIMTQLFAFGAFIPFASALFLSTNRVVHNFWVQTPNPFYWIFALVSLSNNATLAHDPRLSTPRWYLVITYLPAVALLVLLILRSVQETLRRLHERSSWMLLLLLLWTPIVVAMVISITIRPILVERSLIAVSIPLYLLFAWLLVRFFDSRFLQVVIVIFGLTVINSLIYAYPDTPEQSMIVRAVKYIASAQQSGDAVAYADVQVIYPSFFFHPTQPDVYLLPPSSPNNWPNNWSSKWLSATRWPRPQNVQPVAQFASQYQRVWLVLTIYNMDLPYQQQVNHTWLKQHGHLVEDRDFQRARVFLYQLDRED